tara:strand:+ start:145 stop:1275 length:1131 start_codon:yes stop_codon:yes gene_type:complete
MKINEVVTIKEDAMEIAKTLMSLSGEEIVALSAALTMTVPVLKGLFKTGKGIMKVKRMMDRASVRIANGIVKEDRINEIEYSSDVQKDDMSKYDLDDMIGSTESTGKKINGYEIHTIDEGDVSFLVKEPYGDGFLGELRLKPEHKYEGMHKSVVFFDEVIQGKGIAPLLYKMAIVDYGHTIVSDYKQSKGSKTLWERLAKMSGVFVYGWNPRAKGDKEFFQWDPTEDSDSVIYHGDSSTDVLRDELDALMKDIGSRKQSGELSAEQAQVEWNEGKKEISAELKDADLVRYNDIRLIATADNNLDESIGALMGMILPTHAAMYKKAAAMMSEFHDEYPSYGLNKLAALVSRRTAKDFDRRALVQTYKKQYPSSNIEE